jgi:adenylosuccinate lyase
MFLHSLKAISPIDGRHRIITAPLGEWFSEFALHKFRANAEIEYFIALSELDAFPAVRKFSEEEKAFLRRIVKEFSLEDAQVINNIDRFGYNGMGPTNHDVKSVEYFIKMKLEGSSLQDMAEMVHFGLTSEDINNIAFDCMIQGLLDHHYIPALVKLMDTLAGHAEKEKISPMLSKTHGQPATPTTFGKEMANYLERLRIELVNLAGMRLPAKLNGAVGSHNAQHFAAPEIDWIAFADGFIKKLGFEPNLLTTQIEPHDGFTRLFSTLISINNILRDLSIDFWMYISAGYMVQRKIGHEVGSSTMPHKINPWRMEVAEGSTVEANFKLMGFVNKLQVSRLQRDLSDHEAERAIGVGLAHSYIAVLHISEELGRLSVNASRMLADLDDRGEILTEAVQTLLRKEGYDKPYELMKDVSRGQNLTVRELHDAVKKLKIGDKVKDRIMQLRPETYTGVADKLVDITLKRWRKFKAGYSSPCTGVKKVFMDCRQLTPEMFAELPRIAASLGAKGVRMVGIDAPKIHSASFSEIIPAASLPADEHAVFVGILGEMFEAAKGRGMLCVNLESVSRKKAEYNVFRLSELEGLIGSVNDAQ